MNDTTDKIQDKGTVITGITKVIEDAVKHPVRTALILGVVSKAIARILKAAKKDD